MRGPGLVARIVGLAVAGIVVAFIAGFVITFRGPPPMPAPTRLADLAAFATRGTPMPAASRTIIAEVTAEKPEPRPGEKINLAGSRSFTRVTGRAATIWLDQAGPLPTADNREPELRGGFTVAIRRTDGWLAIRSARNSWPSAWHRVTVMAMLGAALLLGLAAWVVARAIVRPVARLAAAADEINVGKRPSPIEPQGPREIRALALALSAMQARLGAQLAERTAMLAAIAHDLGTPLSRLAFQIDKLPDTERERAEAELAEMRAMIISVIDVARHDPARLTRAPVALAPLVADLGEPGMTLDVDERVTVSGDAGALRRMISNLIENGRRYGGAIALSCQSVGAEAVITVSDDGPGIDPALLPRIFEPFVRGEPSRNRETGGAGLGLSIVRDIAQAHGGGVVLENVAPHGLRATVRLPLSRNERL